MAKKVQIAENAIERPKRAVRSSANFILKPTDQETPTGISLTVPDMTMDLKTMIARRNNGMIIPMQDGQFYDEDYPEVYKMDQVELIEFRLRNAQRIEELLEEQHEATKLLEQLQNQPPTTIPPTPAQPEA